MMWARGKHFDGEEKVDLALTIANSFASPLNPLCSLWRFSAFSVLNSEKRNTEATKNHRAAEPQRKVCARSNNSNSWRMFLS
jgi:hypothetical protein